MRIRMEFLAIAAMGMSLIQPEPAWPQVAEDGVAAASFMVGCWAEPGDDGSGLREIYAAPAANMLTGLSQFWRDGRIVDYEFHRIDGSPAGPVLTPHPRGVASVPFRPVEIGADQIAWQNLEHDFPQRIIYRRVAVDTLVVRIEGGEGDAARSIEWRMARAACPG